MFNIKDSLAESPGMIPEQHSDRLQAGELCFTRLIGLLLGDQSEKAP
jgi:hypothetical protein